MQISQDFGGPYRFALFTTAAPRVSSTPSTVSIDNEMSGFAATIAETGPYGELTL